MNVLVTAGATREKIDPVRFISNNSTGKMGYAIARNCMLRGARVVLVTAKTNIPSVPFVETIDVESAEDMFHAVEKNYLNADIIIKAAAVADYCSKTISDEKIKKKDDDMSLQLERTQDILQYLGENKKENQFLCGFSMETENVIANSKAKLTKKNLDMIVANNLKDNGAGFGTDTNIVTFITANETIEHPIMSKDEVSNEILNYILKHKRI